MPKRVLQFPFNEKGIAAKNGKTNKTHIWKHSLYPMKVNKHKIYCVSSKNWKEYKTFLVLLPSWGRHGLKLLTLKTIFIC